MVSPVAMHAGVVGEDIPDSPRRAFLRRTPTDSTPESKMVANTRRLPAMSLAIIVLSFSCGCMAVDGRINRGVFTSDLNYYVGTRFDCRLLSHAGATTAGDVVCALDLPFSFVADTVLVPVDLVRVEANKPPPERPVDSIKYAAIAGDLAKVVALINSDPSLTRSRDEQENTPLHFAAYHGHTNVVAFLLANHADVSAQNSRGVTSLHMAASAGLDGHKDVAELLRQPGGRE